jgi:hypothetical protein
VLDVEQVLRRMLEMAVSAFDAAGGAVYLSSAGEPRLVQSHGDWRGEGAVRVPLARGDQQLGELVLGPRRDGERYSTHDLAHLSDTAGSVARLISLVDWLRS